MRISDWSSDVCSSDLFLYPVHPNPNVKDVAYEFLARLPNFTLCEPLDYAPFIAAMKRAYLILTDSGGVQEEAPALGDRKSVVSGKSVSVRVDLGGRRIIKKKKDLTV